MYIYIYIYAIYIYISIHPGRSQHPAGVVQLSKQCGFYVVFHVDHPATKKPVQFWLLATANKFMVLRLLKRYLFFAIFRYFMIYLLCSYCCFHLIHQDVRELQTRDDPMFTFLSFKKGRLIEGMYSCSWMWNSKHCSVPVPSWNCVHPENDFMHPEKVYTTTMVLLMW